MKKLDNFSNCLNVLKNADFELANDNEIYRTVPAFLILEKTLRKKLEEADGEWV